MALGPGRKRPDGGNGGRGGDVYVVADKDMSSFTMQTFHYNGGAGTHGGSGGLTGKRGNDVYVHVPLGTLISERMDSDDEYTSHYDYDEEIYDDDLYGEDETEEASVDNEESTKEDMMDESEDAALPSYNTRPVSTAKIVSVSEIIESQVASQQGRVLDDSVDEYSAKKIFKKGKRNKKDKRRARRDQEEAEDQLDTEAGDEDENVIIDMDIPGVPIRLSEGGRPGVGNKAFSGTGTSRARSLPKTKLPGRQGDKRSLILELKLIADVGLVGFPNAGKSSLLKALSNAKPKIAAYPFTTLHPNIGVVEYSDMGRITVADIPGLIEGAHEDRGLGHDFLRHIVRTQVLLYVVDGAGTEGREPAEDLHCLVEELRQYDSQLLDKPSFVFCNKAEIKGTKVRRRRLAEAAASHGMLLIEGSALKGVEIGAIAMELRKNVEFAKANKTK